MTYTWDVPLFPWFKGDVWLYIRDDIRGATDYISGHRYIGHTHRELTNSTTADSWSSRVVLR